jgi:hypothetical protein
MSGEHYENQIAFNPLRGGSLSHGRRRLPRRLH